MGTALNGEVHRDMVLLETGEVAVRCCILVATDGLFDMMSNDAAVDIAFNHWSDPAAAAEEMIVKTGRENVKQSAICNLPAPCFDANNSDDVDANNAELCMV